jgi:hypothetical protein
MTVTAHPFLILLAHQSLMSKVFGETRTWRELETYIGLNNSELDAPEGRERLHMSLGQRSVGPSPQRRPSRILRRKAFISKIHLLV